MPDARRLATAAFNLTLAAPRSCCSLCNPPSLQHSCLTRGDWLSVRHADSQYDLKICALTPEPACSVIDTDLEVGKQSCSCAAVMCGCSSRRLLLAPCGPACASPPRALPRYSSVTLLAHSPVCLAPQAEINPSIETEERIREEYEAAARRAANEERVQDLLETFRVLDIDPILVSSSDPAEVLAPFLAWSDLRRTRRVLGA